MPASKLQYYQIVCYGVPQQICLLGIRYSEHVIPAFLCVIMLTSFVEIEALSNTFCPDVLASASASAATQATATAGFSSPSQPTDPTIASQTDQTQPHGTALSVANPSATSFGADTPGTNWKSINDGDSTANRGPAFEAISIILLCVTAMILAFRFFARWYTKSLRNTVQSIGWDDWLAVIALIGTAGVTATIILGTNHGMGKHLPVTTSLHDLEDLLKVKMLSSPLSIYCADSTVLDYLCFCSSYHRCPRYTESKHSEPLYQDDTYANPQADMLRYHGLCHCSRHRGAFRLHLLLCPSFRILESVLSHDL